jgi:hypothetical protein
MRLCYAIAGVLLLLLAFWLGACHLRFKAPPPEKALAKTPKEADFKRAPAKAEDRAAKIPDIKPVWEKNVFSQSRGNAEKPEAGAAAKQIDLELIGICKFGTVSGAVIGSKSRGLPAPAAPGGIPAAGGDAQSKSGRKFYSVGQKLANGFQLKEVHGDRVVLARGGEELVLKIQFESDSSKSRRLASVNYKISEPAAPAPGSQAAPQDPRQQGLEDAPKGLPRPPAAPPMAVKREAMS